MRAGLTRDYGALFLDAVLPLASDIRKVNYVALFHIHSMNQKSADKDQQSEVFVWLLFC